MLILQFIALLSSSMFELVCISKRKFVLFVTRFLYIELEELQLVIIIILILMIQ